MPHCLHPAGCSAAHKHVDRQGGPMLTRDSVRDDLKIGIGLTGGISSVSVNFSEGYMFLP